MQTAFVFLALAAAANAQSPGSVSSSDATVTAPDHPADISAKIELTGNNTIVAKDHTAPIALTRGGTVNLCRTSSLHLAGTPDTLLLGLDRGALEIHTKATATDAILTPDLRITTTAGGPLDLRMRVSSNGDTCIENRGRKAPTLQLRDNFGEASYLVLPNQHVLFEHGSLKAVVDRETTPCGCPPPDSRPVSIAEAILHGTGARVTPQQAAAANPFPTAQSEGLAPAPPLPPDKIGQTQTQVSTVIAFDPTSAPPASAAAPPPVPTAKAGPFHAIGHFFKRIFVR